MGQDHEVSARRIRAGPGADRDRTPGVRQGEEAREKLAADPAPRKRRPREGVEDRDRVASVPDPHGSDEVAGVVLEAPEGDGGGCVIQDLVDRLEVGGGAGANGGAI